MINAIQLRNVFKRDAAQSEAHVQTGITHGTVTTFDPVTQSAKVLLQPAGVETGYLPIKTAWAGPGWGLFSPPSVGTLVDVHFEDGDLESGSIIGRAHNDVDKPLPVPAGELWAVHSSGLRLCLTNDGKALLGGTVQGDGIVMLGNTGDLHKLVKDTFQALFNAHCHTGVGVGGGTSGPPRDADKITDKHMTTETKAS